MNLTLKEKIAGMLLIGIPNKESINGVLDLIRNYSIGGVILYKNNYDNLSELKCLIKRLKNANKENKLPLTIAIDQEGGRVNRLPCEFINSHSIYRMAKNTSEDIRVFSNISSKLLSNLGINLNLAPVLDLKMHNNNHAIGDRAISNEPNKVIEVSKIIVDEFKNNKVVPVIKHFPGQGSVSADSHFLLPIILDYDKILSKDIKPFEYMINNGIDSLMLGHILIKNKTGMYPATLSRKFIKEELRERLNYKNIIMTDEMGMRSVSYLYGKKRSIVKAFYAGNDIICLKYSKNFIGDIIYKVSKKVENNIIDIKDINDSINRIITLKEKYKFNDNTYFDNIDIEEYNKIINELKNKC